MREGADTATVLPDPAVISILDSSFPLFFDTLES